MIKYPNRYIVNKIDKPYQWYLDWLRKKGYSKHDKRT